MPRTTITPRFSEPCWRFLISAEDTDLVRLSPEIRAVLQGDPQDTVALLRIQAYELLEFLARTYEVLPKDDDRRQVCLQCLSDIEDAIIRARSS